MPLVVGIRASISHKATRTACLFPLFLGFWFCPLAIGAFWEGYLDATGC